ncbi:MAG: B12-binding domain-containing radical SAM protein [Candidatus Hydrogenedentes bacterium]|nr:B12-binding domain-containing radical SAM protein [Candidatus Hydrogenedentota bacterium]
MSMNILLIAPAEGKWKRIGQRKTFNGKTFRFSMLSLLSVAALSPKNATVRIVDEQVEDIPDDGFDLVGITAMTAVAPRAYELCALFRKRGIPVVMGGFHATLNREEALRHADAVVVGPAYGAWQRVCEDVQQGRLQREYFGDLDSAIPVHLPRHLLDRDRYVTVSSTFATLGCRNRCRFCSIHPFHDGKRCTRPVAEVVAEVAAFRDRFFVFVDDNLTQDRDYAVDLFRALAPLKKRWVLQASTEVKDDPELLAAMRDAGCLGVFIGLETFSEEALEQSDKGFNRPQQYRDAIRAFHRHGMYVEAGVIVGFDADDVTVFSNTLRMLEWIGIDAIQLSILTPLPGTALFDAVRGRITDADWGHYDYRHVVFTPERMSAEELQAGADWLIRSFYSPWRILRRVWRWVTVPNGWKHVVYPVGLNLAYFGRTWRFGIGGHDPARSPARTLAAERLA